MTTIARVRASLTGFPGGPGVATIYGLDGPALVPVFREFWQEIKGALPAAVGVQVEPTGDLIDAATGELTGSWNSDPVAHVQGTDNSIYAAAAGFLARWETGVVMDGRRVRGKTFVVPMAASAMANDGAIGATALAALNAAAGVMARDGSPSFCIWHRPFAGKAATDTQPARPSHVGAAVLVVAGSVPNKIVVLRTRRD